MLATHAPLLSSHSSYTLAPSSSLLSSSRLALADSTNVNSRSNACNPGFSKGSIYPTSTARTGCGYSGFESSIRSTSTSCHSRHQPLSPTPSLFPMTYKALPTVSISLSAACSQNVSGERFCGSRAQGLEQDLPDVRSVVPFPVAPLDGDMDVDMLDGTGAPCPDGHSPSVRQAPRKRRSAHSSVSCSQGGLGMDAKQQKRPKKSKRQVAELWWLGVVHRSISRGIEVRQSVGKPDVSNGLSCDLDAMDRMLVERIQNRLAENGCAEGRPLPNPLPRISSPSISMPSLVLLAPSTRTPPVNSAPPALSSELNPGGNNTRDGMVTSRPASEGSSCASLQATSHSPIPSPRSTSHRRHVHFEIPKQPRRAQPSPTIPRRSPSPPPRTGVVSANAQTLTLTMPQLVASLTLAYHERNKLRLRERAYKVTGCGNEPGRSPLSVPSQAVSYNDSDVLLNKERAQPPTSRREKLSSTPEMKSPLSRVVYTES